MFGFRWIAAAAIGALFLGHAKTLHPAQVTSSLPLIIAIPAEEPAAKPAPTPPDPNILKALIADVTDGIRQAENAKGKEVELIAYIPCEKKNYTGKTFYFERVYGKVKQRSGVTIATGTDLGTRSAEDIDQLPLTNAAGENDSLAKAKLKRFTAKEGAAAIYALRQYYLRHKKEFSISQSTALQIEEATHHFEMERLVMSYDRDRTLYPQTDSFYRLPREVRLGIYSYFYQNGTHGEFAEGGLRRAIWDAFCRGDFEGVIAHMNKYKDKGDKERRQHEIEMIRTGWEQREPGVISAAR